MLLGDESALYADAAYSSEETRNTLEQWGIDDQVQRKGYRNHPLSESDKDRNAHIAVTRMQQWLGSFFSMSPGIILQYQFANISL